MTTKKTLIATEKEINRIAEVLEHQPMWTSVEGVKVLQVPNSQYVAVPATGRENSKVWHVIDLNDRTDIVTQLSAKEVRSWLVKASMSD